MSEAECRLVCVLTSSTASGVAAHIAERREANAGKRLHIAAHRNHPARQHSSDSSSRVCKSAPATRRRRKSFRHASAGGAAESTTVDAAGRDRVPQMTRRRRLLGDPLARRAPRACHVAWVCLWCAGTGAASAHHVSPSRVRCSRSYRQPCAAVSYRRRIIWGAMPRCNPPRRIDEIGISAAVQARRLDEPVCHAAHLARLAADKLGCRHIAIGIRFHIARVKLPMPPFRRGITDDGIDRGAGHMPTPTKRACISGMAALHEIRRRRESMASSQPAQARRSSQALASASTGIRSESMNIHVIEAASAISGGAVPSTSPAPYRRCRWRGRYYPPAHRCRARGGAGGDVDGAAASALPMPEGSRQEPPKRASPAKPPSACRGSRLAPSPCPVADRQVG